MQNCQNWSIDSPLVRIHDANSTSLIINTLQNRKKFSTFEHQLPSLELFPHSKNQNKSISNFPIKHPFIIDHSNIAHHWIRKIPIVCTQELPKNSEDPRTLTLHPSNLGVMTQRQSRTSWSWILIRSVRRKGVSLVRRTRVIIDGVLASERPKDSSDPSFADLKMSKGTMRPSH